MNNVEKLADLFGSKRALADAWGVDPAIVTRAIKTGRVPVYHNYATRAAMRDKVDHMGPEQGLAFVEAVLACLDPAVCPTCGQPIDDGRVL